MSTAQHAPHSAPSVMRLVPWLLAILHLAAPPLLPCLQAGETAADDPNSKLLAQARKLSKDPRGHAEATRACEEVIASEEATKEQKLEAFALLTESFRQKRKFPLVIKTMDRLRAAFPDDRELDKKALLEQMSAYWSWNKTQEVAEKAKELIGKHPDDKVALAGAQMWRARALLRLRKLEECYEAAAKSIELDPANAERAADALAHMADAMWQKGDMEKCLDASMRLLEPKHLSHRNEREHPNYQKRPGECLLRLQRYAEAAAHFLRIEKRTENQLFAQECCLQAGRAFLSAQHYADARKTLERVLLDYPEHTDYWHHAQQGIVEALGSEGRFKQALQAARILLDASRDRNYIAQNTRLIAELFQAIDKHVGRANQMINFQRFGPDGEDGKAGTADDLNDPLIAMGRPAYPERERAFAGARRKAGDTAAASRYRALTYIYAGQPKEALKHYIDAFARARGNDFRTMGNDLIVIGARAVRGHAVGLKAFADFVNYGPAGPDGKPGTPDDLTDPFALLLR